MRGPALDEAAVAQFLRAAHAAISAGDPAQALRLVLTVLQATGGQAAAAPALNRVLDQLTAESPASGGARSALAELTEMLARASLDAPPPVIMPSTQAGASHAAGAAAAQPAATTAHSDDSMSISGGAGAVAAAAAAGGGARGAEEATSSWSGGGGALLGRQPHAPILSETGREGFMDCALADGSSYVCGGCGGVVIASRRRQHEQFWCSAGSGAGSGAGAGAAASADEELGSD